MGSRFRMALALVLLAAPGCGLGRYSRPDLEVAGRPPSATTRRLELRVVLVGDAGESRPGKGPGQGAVLRSLRARVLEAADRTLIVWLGDNVYPRGIPSRTPCDTERASPLALERERERAAASLRAQLEVTSGTPAEALFLPGNHDWDQSGPCGLERVRAQAEWIRERAASLGARATFLPPDGCPGPLYLDRGPLRLVVLDSEWLLTPELGRESLGCSWGDVGAAVPYEPGSLTDGEVYDRVARVLGAAGDRVVVVSSHHPLFTRSTHGGYHPLVDYLFPLRELNPQAWIPLPVIGALYPPLRHGVVRSDQDLAGPRNRAMREGLLGAFQHGGPPLFHVAGHDHALQVLAPDATGAPGKTTFLVSGAGSKRAPVGRARGTMYKSPGPGYMVLDLERDGPDRPLQAHLEVVEVSERECRVGFCFDKDPRSGAVHPCAGASPCP